MLLETLLWCLPALLTALRHIALLVSCCWIRGVTPGTAGAGVLRGVPAQH